MTRLTLIVVALLSATTPFADSAEPKPKPNIVLFLADDLSCVDCSPYGGKGVPTPNMARLAADGMTLTQAFVASPSCAPSRAALLTAMTPMRNGSMLNHSKPRASLKKWPAYFKDLGYEVVAIGKVAHYAQVRDYGFDHASHFNYHQDDCIEAAVKWMQDRKSTKPLCLLVGTNWPHVPWPKTSDIDPKTTKLPPTLVDNLKTRQSWTRYLAAVSNADRDLGLAYDAAKKHLGKDVFFAFTSDHGAQFPFGKWTAYDYGVRTPMITAWSGRIKPGTKSDAMVSWLDLLPTCLQVAGGVEPKGPKGLKGIDGQSFLDVLQGESEKHREKIFLTHSGDGKMNRYPLRAVRTPQWKYIRNLDPEGEFHSHVDRGPADSDGRGYFDSWVELAKTDAIAAAILKRYHKRPAEELYDLNADPWELKNLAEDARHKETLRKLRADLDAWMASQGDEGPKTEKGLPDPQPKKEKK